jgi:hypothetical protein
MIPDFRRLAVLANIGFPGAVQEIGEVKAAARAFDVDIVDMLEIRAPKEITPAFAALRGGAQALYVCCDAVTNAARAHINDLALGARLPTIYPTAYFSKLAASSLMESTTRTFTGARAIMSTRFCTARNPPTFRSSSPRNSSLRSTSKLPGRSGSTCRPRCSPALTR